MKWCTHLSVVLLALYFVTVSMAQDDCQVEVYPVEIAYKSDNFEHQVIDDCVPFLSNATSTPSIDPTQYVHCNHPTTITDSNTGPPTYIWGEDPGQILFIFASEVKFSNISIEYIFNSTNGRAKLRLFAVPEDFQVWDSVSDSSFPTEVFNEIPPEEGAGGIRSVPDATEGTVQFNTTRVLLEKVDDTKTYNFLLREVTFWRYCDSVPVTESTAATTGTVNTNTTTDTLPTTTTESSMTTGFDDSSGHAVYGNYRIIVILMTMAIVSMLP